MPRRSTMRFCARFWMVTRQQPCSQCASTSNLAGPCLNPPERAAPGIRDLPARLLILFCGDDTVGAMNIKGGRFVITGGASLIGSHVADALLWQDAREVVLLDNFALGTPQMVSHLLKDARVKLVRADILRVSDLYDSFADTDGVFAIAGFLTLPLTQNPPLGLAVNVDGQVNVFEACRY